MFEMKPAPAFIAMENVGTGDGVRVRLQERTITAVLARKGQTGAVIAAATAGLGLSLRDAPIQSPGAGMAALGIGPGRWLFLGPPPDALTSLSPFASLSDHSDGYAVFEIWGSKVRRALAKGVPVDLQPDIFADAVAVTVIAHIGAIVWQSAPDRFAIAVFRSYAGSFWEWLTASAAEYGLVVETG